MELLILLQTLRLDSPPASRRLCLTCAMGVRTKKDQPRIPITSRLVADIIQIAGADRYMSSTRTPIKSRAFSPCPEMY